MSGAIIVIGGIILSMTLTQLILSQAIELISWFGDSGIQGKIAFIGLYVVFGILVIPASFHKYLSGILFGFTIGLLIAWVGAMIAAIIPFLLGKRWLNPYAQKLLDKNPKLRGLEKAIIVDKLVIDESEVTNESNFMSDLGADSLDTVELIMEFEKEFDVQIPDDEAEKITTVGEAIKYLEERS